MSVGTATHCMVYVTAPSRDEAATIGRVLVTERLAACANILAPMQSIYEWEGAIEESEEAVLLLKTRKDLAARVLARVEDLHSYEVPCAVVYDMKDGLPAYLNWIDAATA